MALLHQCHINPSNSCPLCNSHTETIEHVLRNCSKVTPIGTKFGVPNKILTEDYQVWLQSNSLSDIKHKLSISWGTIFITLCVRFG